MIPVVSISFFTHEINCRKFSKRYFQDRYKLEEIRKKKSKEKNNIKIKTYYILYANDVPVYILPRRICCDKCYCFSIKLISTRTKSLLLDHLIQFKDSNFARIVSRVNFTLNVSDRYQFIKSLRHYAESEQNGVLTLATLAITLANQCQQQAARSISLKKEPNQKDHFEAATETVLRKMMKKVCLKLLSYEVLELCEHKENK